MTWKFRIAESFSSNVQDGGHGGYRETAAGGGGRGGVSKVSFVYGYVSQRQQGARSPEAPT